MSSAGAVPLYFELSWSILSTIGLLTCGIGLSICLLVGLSPLSSVPIITSAACAIANGLCYYAFYAQYPVHNRMVAAAIADICWLIQEAGLSFYSYLILRRLLRLKKDRWFFLGTFWVIMVAIAAVRFMILVKRAMSLNDQQADNTSSEKHLHEQRVINHLHVAYFVLIAVAEVVCAFHLLRIFTRAQRASASTLALGRTNKNSIFRILARSTEVRLALLAPIGITRSITYSFQVASQSATNTASQLDRFAYTLECMFPIVLLVDLLAAKLKINSSEFSSSSRGVGQYNHGGIHYLNSEGLNTQGHNQSMWSRVVCTATAGGSINGKGKELEADQISLAPAVHINDKRGGIGRGEIMLRTQIRQEETTLEEQTGRSEDLSRESSHGVV